MSLNPTSPLWKHDVFVSFKGNDMYFVNGLFDWLKRLGISHFPDHRREGPKEENKAERLDAIGNWKFAIALVVFSKNYVEFNPCWNELDKILECQRDRGLMVIPIFCGNGAAGDKYKERKTAIQAQKISGYEWSQLTEACQCSQGNKSEPLDIIVERLVKEIHSLYRHKFFGPFGGEGEETWEWTRDEIKGIDVVYGNFITSICFQVNPQPNTKPQHGRIGEKKTYKVQLEEGEYMSSFAGYFENAEDKKIKSLTFRTNKRILGPIGEEGKEEEYFSVPSKAGRVIKFSWTSNNDFLKSIGADVELRSKEFDPVESAKLFFEKSKNWNDGNRFNNVKEITVKFDPTENQRIQSIAFQYKGKDGELWQSETDCSKTMASDDLVENQTSISKKIGPFGGGYAWDDGKFNGVRKICGFKYDTRYFKFVYDNGSVAGATVTHPEVASTGSSEKAEYSLDYPREYLTSIAGYKQNDGSISALRFHSNKKIYEYGNGNIKSGEYFNSPLTGSRIIGFHGTSGETLKSIGVYVEPILHLRPFGIIRPDTNGHGGTPWDDGVHSNVRGFRVMQTTRGKGKLIESVTFKYDDNGSEVKGPLHGGGNPNPDEWVELDFPEERLLAITGYISKDGPAGLTVIHSLEITTTKDVNTKMYARRQKLEGSEKFEFPKKPERGRRIVGFFGMATRDDKSIGHLNYIGARLEPY